MEVMELEDMGESTGTSSVWRIVRVLGVAVNFVAFGMWRCLFWVWSIVWPLIPNL